MALSHVLGIRRGLALDAAVSIEVTSSAPLGRDSDLIGTGRVRAGLGFPVAMEAIQFSVPGFDNIPNQLHGGRWLYAAAKAELLLTCCAVEI